MRATVPRSVPMGVMSRSIVANNLVSGDTNNASDIFVHDRQTGTTTRVSAARDGTQGDDHSGCPVLSADGRYVAFTSWADNLTEVDPNGDISDVFVHDRQTGTTTASASLATELRRTIAVALPTVAPLRSVPMAVMSRSIPKPTTW